MATGDVSMRSKLDQLPSLGSSESSSSANPETEQPAQNGEWEGPPRRNTIDLNYMHRPPTILPNYGKRKGVLKLKTNVPRVLLFDNVTQQTMLDVELTCLQSQRHKADRELSMQARSFMLRRQFKQRFLKNLTKVFHDDDYWQFEQEYFGLSNTETQRKEAWSNFASGNRNEGHFLPSLPNGREGDAAMVRKTHEPPHQHHQILNSGSAVKPVRGRKRQNSDLPNARWSAADATGNSRGRREVTNGFTKDKHRDLSLPHIKISPPHSSSQQSAPSELLHFSPPGKVGFRFQKTPSGITRIFHAHDNMAEGDTGHQTDGGPTGESSPAVNGKAINENGTSKEDTPSNKSEDNRVNKTPDITNAKINDDKEKTKSDASLDTLQKPRPFKNFRRITNPFAEKSKAEEEEISSTAQPVEEDIYREFPATTDQPTLDHRFKHLNKLLVKQDPPNDGYIELSPSFARNGPVQKLHHRIRELQLDAGLAVGPGVRDGSARSFRDNVSQGVTPVLSEVDHSESEGEEEQHDHSTNDALRRLGGM
ncbi:hypothetical protein ElyMa_003777900 [Elysia marginata]|uniref:Uncharacterized protein n=1 Tax=Elysia marginata TaxID=1093978 RepID=A0AAV4F9U8_9GAST|nr:hypothetical protein ElyMa_003777900 [Elysia marginata]